MIVFLARILQGLAMGGEIAAAATSVVQVASEFLLSALVSVAEQDIAIMAYDPEYTRGPTLTRPVDDRGPPASRRRHERRDPSSAQKSQISPAHLLTSVIRRRDPGADQRCTEPHDRALGWARLRAVVHVLDRAGHRDVAQLGSALDWGSRGRRFKSCRPDGVSAGQRPGDVVSGPLTRTRC